MKSYRERRLLKVKCFSALGFSVSFFEGLESDESMQNSEISTEGPLLFGTVQMCNCSGGAQDEGGGGGAHRRL